MAKMIQIRNVPDELHREVKVRAAKAGMTLSDYLKRELERIVAVPEIDEVMHRIRSRTRPEMTVPIVDLIRADRESR